MWYFFIFSLYYRAVFCYSIPPTGVAPLTRLNDGNFMPSFGLGTWLGFNGEEDSVAGIQKLTQRLNQNENSQRLSGDENPIQDHGEVNKVACDPMEQSVEAAIDAGYRLIDTAKIYFTEDQVGKAVNKKIKDGVVKREEMFITTKLWNDMHAREDVVPALRESLAKLNLDYVDLYLIHWPISTYTNDTISDIDYIETWQGMIEAKRLGLARSIGICSFNVNQLERLLRSTDVTPAVLQIEISLNIQQDDLRKFSHDHGIVVMGFSPFGSLFPNKAAPQSPQPRVDDPKLIAISKKYRKTVPQVVLRYLFELGVVPIPKTLTKGRAIENLDIFDFELKQEDKEFLKKYDTNYRTANVYPLWGESKNYPFEIPN